MVAQPVKGWNYSLGEFLPSPGSHSQANLSLQFTIVASDHHLTRSINVITLAPSLSGWVGPLKAGLRVG